MAWRIAPRSIVLSILVACLLAPAPAMAGSPLSADLDGKPIPLESVAQYYCHDFDYPRIHCFGSQAGVDAAAARSLDVVTSSASTSDYVQIFENSLLSGASMYVSQDYNALAFIGWNDRISSFRAVNYASGSFFVDWFYGGAMYSFCCNSTVYSLGSYNDTFSAVRRG